MNEEVRSIIDAAARAWPEASKHLTTAGRELVASLRAFADAFQNSEPDGDASPEPVRPVPIRKRES